MPENHKTICFLFCLHDNYLCPYLQLHWQLQFTTALTTAIQGSQRLAYPKFNQLWTRQPGTSLISLAFLIYQWTWPTSCTGFLLLLAFRTKYSKDVQAGSQSYASHCVSVRIFPTCISLLCILRIMNQFSLFPNVKPKIIGEIDQQAIYVKWFLDKTQNAWNTLHILASIAVELDAAQDG